jgi:radical SAM protein with 4Fe4S-binding SPASM domain
LARGKLGDGQLRRSIGQASYEHVRKKAKEHQPSLFISIDDLAVFSRIDGNGENQKCMLESDQMRTVITKVDDITGYQIPSGNRRHEKVCAQILHSFSIDWYGNIHPCNRLKTILGNIVTDEISDVWNNSPIMMKIAETCWNDLPECSVCEYMKYCVRCAGGALDELNRIYSKSTVACAIARARHSNANIDI